MEYNIADYFKNHKNGTPLSSSLSSSDILASRLWALGKDISSENVLLLTNWLKLPSISKFYLVEPIIKSIKGADKLLSKELYNYPYDINTLILNFKKVAGKNAEWTSDQIKTARRIFRFLRGNGTMFRVNGEGGTGKTTVIVEIAIFLAQCGLIHRIIFAAPTHKALQVMESRFNTRADAVVKRITQFMSIHKLLGFESDFNNEGEQTFVQRKNVNLSKSDLIIIDEISMAASDMSELIINTKNCKIICSGDLDQLPPVGEPFSTLCVDDRIIEESTMRETVRNADPKVIKLFKAMRKWIEHNKMPDWKSLKSDKVKFYGTKKYNSKVETKWMKEFMKTDSLNPIILTWTRKQRDEYNDYVRHKLHNKRDLERFEPHERLTLGDFYKIPESGNNPLRLHTSEQIEVISAKECSFANLEFMDIYPKKAEFGMAIRVERDYRQALSNIKRVIGSTYRIWKLTVIKLGEIKNPEDSFVINVIHESSSEQRSRELKLIKRYILNLQNSFGRWNPAAMNTLTAQIIKPMFKECHRVMSEPFGIVEYGYGMTAHQSQGSGYSDVWVDMQDILKNFNITEARKCLYTAMSRSFGKVHILL